jgi:hypothetical protein
MADGFRGPLDARLSQELWALATPVHPGWLAAAFRDQCDAGVFWEGISCAVAFALFAEGDAAPGGKDRSGAGQGVKPGEVRLALGVLGDGFVEVLQGLPGVPELGDEGLAQEGVGGDDPCISRPGCGALDGLEASGDDSGRTPVVVMEAARQGGAACEWHGFAGRPAAQDVAKEHRLFLVKPLQDMGKIVFERPGQAIRETDCVANEVPTGLDKVRQGAHRGAVGGERGELIAVCEEECDLEGGIGGLVFGPARGNASRYFARVDGWTGKSTRKS